MFQIIMTKDHNRFMFSLLTLGPCSSFSPWPDTENTKSVWFMSFLLILGSCSSFSPSPALPRSMFFLFTQTHKTQTRSPCLPSHPRRRLQYVVHVLPSHPRSGGGFSVHTKHKPEVHVLGGGFSVRTNQNTFAYGQGLSHKL